MMLIEGQLFCFRFIDYRPRTRNGPAIQSAKQLFELVEQTGTKFPQPIEEHLIWRLQRALAKDSNVVRVACLMSGITSVQQVTNCIVQTKLTVRTRFTGMRKMVDFPLNTSPKSPSYLVRNPQKLLYNGPVPGTSAPRYLDEGSQSPSTTALHPQP